MDAGIACWESKRAYDSVRPITAIRYALKGKRMTMWAGQYNGIHEIDAKRFQPYQTLTFVTPAFPEYPSGHSSFSAAAAEVLERFTGSDHFGLSVTRKAGESPVEPFRVPKRPVEIHMETFTDAANLAGVSRRFGGIHFIDGDLDAREMGRKVGAKVWQQAQRHIQGRG
jgi:hypothetical protein